MNTPDKASSDRRLILAAEHAAFDGATRTEADSDLATSQPVFFQPPRSDSFPGYSLVREIHRGAQGIVYQAIQKATKRKVAIKIMRDDSFQGARGKARFDREVQILGQLQHPNIVGIHDSGACAGSFYFVMDYISGQPLDVFMASGELSVDETLQLFIKICHAVSAAHLRGVIHRDLKPGNIRIDVAGEPHVLDFGLAKIATGEMTDGSTMMPMTMTGQFLGTLPWASPEQAEGAPDRLDIRTDVYSLGVILYQMLTARFPYSVVGPMREVLDNILHVAPVPPRSVRRQVNDEVETIVLKCLKKEPDRRYQSAGELARDIGHYLAGEPIDAKRDSGWYLLKKTMRRYKFRATVASSFLMILTVAAVLVTLAWRAEAVARTDAERQAHVAKKSKEFAQELLIPVRLPNPPSSGDQRLLTLQRLSLEQHTRDAQAMYKDEPDMHAEALDSIGRGYENLGLYKDAAPHFLFALNVRRQLFGNEHLDVAASLNNLGDCLRYQEDFPRAEPLYEESLAIRRKLLGNADVTVATSLNSLAAVKWHLGDYSSADQLYEEALDIRRKVFGEENEQVASSLNDLAAVPYKLGDYVRAEKLYSDCLKLRRRLLGDNHPEVAATMNNLANCLRDKGDYAAAEALYRQALKVVLNREDLEDEQHKYQASGLTNVASCLIREGRPEEAVPLLEEALALKRERLGNDKPSVAMTLHHLADASYSLGDYQAAERFCHEALETRKRLPPNHPDLASSLHLLGLIHLAQGDAGSAEESLRRALTIRDRVLPSEDWRTAETKSVLGKALVALGRYQEAEPLLLESYALLTDKRGDGDATVLASAGYLADLYDAWGQPEKAVKYREILERPEPRDLARVP